jgi:hypothetical protein
MKDLIIVFGDYRTFDITAKTFAPLLNPNVDIIIDVWDQSSSKNKVLGIEYTDTITHERISNAITPYLNGASLRIKITSIDKCTSNVNGRVIQKYNSAYLQRISSAYNDVIASGIQYDTVIACRPDLYFNDTFFDKTLLLEDFIYVTFLPVVGSKKLSDMCYVMNFNSFIKLFKEFTPTSWNKTHPFKDWHEWVYDYFENHIGHIPMLPFATIARPHSLITDNFQIIQDKAQEWWMAQAWEGIQLDGEDAILKLWNPEFIERTKKRFGGNIVC